MRRFGHFHDEQLSIALASAARKEVDADAAPGLKSCPDKRLVKPSERRAKALEAYREHLPSVLQHYGDALKLGAKARGSSLSNHTVIMQ